VLFLTTGIEKLPAVSCVGRTRQDHTPAAKEANLLWREVEADPTNPDEGIAGLEKSREMGPEIERDISWGGKGTAPCETTRGKTRKSLKLVQQLVRQMESLPG